MTTTRLTELDEYFALESAPQKIRATPLTPRARRAKKAAKQAKESK